MILQELVKYYDRLPQSDIAPYGWSQQKIGFVVVLNEDGSLHAIEEAPGADEASKKGFSLVVPGQSKPSGGGINPCFLWDNATYMLGQVPEGRDAEWAGERHSGFRQKQLELERVVDDDALAAVCVFLKNWSPDQLARHIDEDQVLSGFGVFRVRTASQYVHDREAIRDYWSECIRESSESGDGDYAPSLISGNTEPLARIHEPKIKGVRGAQSSGALLASFNRDAFTSYGKEQSFNAPVGVRDTFRYCTALNKLLARGSSRKVILGDTTVVYWTEKPSPMEDVFGRLLSVAAEDPETAEAVEAYFQSLGMGRPSDAIEDANVRYFVLGLAPNASRISVRFWLTGTVGELADRLTAHISALDLEGAPDGYQFPGIRRLVAETAPPNASGWPDEDRVSPGLAGEVARAVLEGLPYPQSLLIGVVRRMRTEGLIDEDKRRDPGSGMHRRVSIVKACLTRSRRFTDKEIPVALNPEHEATAYHLGRLFALLEKTQIEAHDNKINSTIRDKYFGAAAATPSGIFPRIIPLHNHHLKKLHNPDRKTDLEKKVGEVMDAINDSWPSHHTLEEQGLFFLGYYHQRTDL